jgi:small subunit ribosomal protein S2
MTSIDKMATDGTFTTLSKRERLQITRQRLKLEKNLGSISDLTRLPAAVFVVDVGKEYIAVREAIRLSIPVFAMVDTNSDPNIVDFPIPANDDASKSISLIINVLCDAITEGLNERKMEREKETASKDKKIEKEEALEEILEEELEEEHEDLEAEEEEVVEELEEHIEEEFENTTKELTEELIEMKKSSARKSVAKKSSDLDK